MAGPNLAQLMRDKKYQDVIFQFDNNSNLEYDPDFIDCLRYQMKTIDPGKNPEDTLELMRVVKAVSHASFVWFKSLSDRECFQFVDRIVSEEKTKHLHTYL